jgi:hypothetical protein
MWAQHPIAPSRFERTEVPGPTEQDVPEGHPDLREAYVSHVFKADEAQRAFEAATRPRSGQFKIAIEMVA